MAKEYGGRATRKHNVEVNAKRLVELFKMAGGRWRGLIEKLKAWLNTIIIKSIYYISYLFSSLLRVSLRLSIGKSRRDRILFKLSFLSHSSWLMDIIVPNSKALKPFIVHGAVMLLPVNPDQMFWTVVGKGEELTRKVVRGKRGGTVIVVGANLGLYVLKFAREVGEKGLVIAFEPSPGAYEILLKNIALNGFEKNVYVINKAVSNIDNYIYEFTTPDMEMMDPRASFVIRAGKYKFFTPSVMLDTVVKELNVRPDLITVDTEGAEPEVLEGAVMTVRNYKPTIVVEVHPYREKETLEILKKVVPTHEYNVLKIKRYPYTKDDVAYHLILQPKPPNNPKDLEKTQFSKKDVSY